MTDDEYSVYLVKMPGTIKGAVRIDKDGYPSIYINDDLSPMAKRETLKHEIHHIENNDFFNDHTIEEVEAIKCHGRKNNN